MIPQASARSLEPRDVEWVVAQATRAPSVHNTQPWRFRWDGHVFDVVADRSRGLDVSDPDGREVTISCGAALVNLRLALRQLGCEAVVDTFPDRGAPEVMARVSLLEGPATSDAERQMFAALSRRHTHRGCFADREIGTDLAIALQEAARSEDCELHYVHDAGTRTRVLHLARAAERLGAADDLVRDETMEWAPAPESRRRDGVPARAYTHGAPVAGPDDLPGRDFDVDRCFGSGERGHQPPGPIAVLTTSHDGAAAWLQAGQGLESVLLVAAAQWSFASIHSRVTEVAHLRAELRRELGTADFPQLLLRFGYATTAPTTPRRPPSEVIDAVT